MINQICVHMNKNSKVHQLPHHHHLSLGARGELPRRCDLCAAAAARARS